MNKNKAKGTAAETAVVNFFKKHEPDTKPQRLPLAGNRDIGDVILFAGTDFPMIFEVKASAKYEIGKWLKELDVELHNAQQYFELGRLPEGYLIVKPKGVGVENVGKWWLIQTLDVFVKNGQPTGEFPERYEIESENDNE